MTTILPFSGIDEATGQPVGEPVVINRELTREQTEYTYQEQPETYVAPQSNYAGNLAPLDADASDEDVVAFWKSTEPLTEQQISQLQDAYMSTNDTDLANLLMYRLTGDIDHLSPEQQYQLYLDGTEDAPVEDDAYQGYDPQQVDEIAQWILNQDVDISEGSVQQVLSAELDGDAGTLVQALAMQVAQGRISVEDAMAEAGQSGLPLGDIYQQYMNLLEQTNV